MPARAQSPCTPQARIVRAVEPTAIRVPPGEDVPRQPVPDDEDLPDPQVEPPGQPPATPRRDLATVRAARARLGARRGLHAPLPRLVRLDGRDQVRGRDEAVRRRHGRRRRSRPRDPRRRVHDLRRPVGLRQDDRAADGRRASRSRPSGEILIGGKVVNDLDPVDRDIAMVFQNYALYPHMTVRDNIGFPLRMQKIAKDERRPADRGRGRAARHRRAARAQAGELSGRPAAARGDGPGDRPPPDGVPDGRAALQPRRQAPRPDAGRARQAAPAARRHDALRHPRPDRGDDARGARRRAQPRRDPAGRHAGRALQPPGEHLRGDASSAARR